MDPLSIIGTVAGVATAGVSLVTVLFETLDTYRNAPKEIATIARGIQDLSLVLDQLVEVLSNGREIHTKLLRRSVLAAVKQIDNVHDEVWDLIERGESGFGRVKWTFRKTKMRDLVTRIEAHKSTAQLVCTTLLLAMQQRRVSRSKEREIALFARRRLRRQAENLVNAAHQSLLDLTQGNRYNDDEEDRLLTAVPQQPPEQRITGPTRQTAASPPSPVTTPTIRVSDSDARGDSTSNEQQLDVSSRRDPETAALFLYNMVFSRTAEENPHYQTNAVPNDTNALVIHNPRGRDVVLNSRPFASRVVDNLLHDWTFLSEQEIEEAAEGDAQDAPPQQQRQQDPARTATSDRRQTVGRSASDRNDPRDHPRERASSASSRGSRPADNKNREEGYRPSRDTPKSRPRGHSDTGPRPRDMQKDDPRPRHRTGSSDNSDDDSFFLRPKLKKSSRTAGSASDIREPTDRDRKPTRARARERSRSVDSDHSQTPFHRRPMDRPRGDSRSRSRSRARTDRPPSGESSSKVQKAAMASLIAGATEAFRLRNEPGGWAGEKAKRVLTAAVGAATIDADLERLRRNRVN